MESIVIKRGIDGSDNFNHVTQMFADISSLDDIMQIIETAEGAMRLCIKIDTHHDGVMADVFMDILNKIDDLAREKGIEVRLRIMCMCTECAYKSEKIRDSVCWRSRWDF